MKISAILTSISVGLISFTLPSYSGSKDLKGKIKIDGSSTVFPITEAVSEEYRKEFPKVRVSVGVSGTGGGFKKFLNKETDINNASRPIKAKEMKMAKEKKVEFIELPVAYDGISVVVNPKNKFAETLTISQLKEIWKPGSKIKTWSDVNSKWPKENIKLYGPGADSGTFDYFTEAVVGKSRASRSDYTASEDDNIIVKGVSEDTYGLGYLGYAYYIENKSKLTAASLSKGGKPAIAPTSESIETGSYPLARPVYIYVNKESTKRPELDSYIQYYLKNAGKLSKEVGYVPLSQAIYNRQLIRYQVKESGSKYSH